MKKLCFVATIPAALFAFMKENIQASLEMWSVIVVSNPLNVELLRDLDAPHFPLSIQRKVSPWLDFLVLVQLTFLLHREHVDLVHSITPKAGLLSMLAGYMARIPHRLHTFTGQVWANKRGWKRGILKIFDKLIVSFATHVLVDSPSQLDFLVSEGILTRRKGIVIGHGSICGVNPNRFSPNSQVKDVIRLELKVNKDSIVVLFLGRLNRDKGVLDLADAFTKILQYRHDVILLLVGVEEDVLFSQIQEICSTWKDSLRHVSFTSVPERYMAAADILCLPSYREGFGQVIIEAAASGIPTVASNIYGISDAVEDCETGILFPKGDVFALKDSLLALIEDEVLRKKMGEAGRDRALKLFSSREVTREMLDLYDRIMR